jgi:putative cofactor-binding repeat protein
MQRRFRSWWLVVAATALTVAVLVVGNALINSQPAHSPEDHLNRQSVMPTHPYLPSMPVGGVDLANIQAALDSIAPGGTLTFPKGGVYIVATPLVVPSNITVDGNGSVLETPADSTTRRSDDGIMQVSSGDTIRNFVFDGNVHNQNGVWTQHRHAIIMGTSSDITIDYNTFRNLIGDGIYSNGASSLTIDYNQFYGDHSNRNGISIISGSQIRIYKNTFWSMSRPDMPGAIDLEPNQPSQTLSDVLVENNTINDPAHFGMLEWDSSQGAISNVTFKNNVINGGPAVVGGGSGILIAYGSATVSGNTINNCPVYYGIRWINAFDGSATGNHLNSVEFGISRAHSPSVTISGNTYADIIRGNEVNQP